MSKFLEMSPESETAGVDARRCGSREGPHQVEADEKTQVLDTTGLQQVGTDEEDVPESDSARVTETSQGSGVHKFEPSNPESEEHHSSKRPRLSSDTKVNRPVECEHLFIGDEDAEPIHYRVYGKGKSERLLGRRG